MLHVICILNRISLFKMGECIRYFLPIIHLSPIMFNKLVIVIYVDDFLPVSNLCTHRDPSDKR